MMLIGAILGVAQPPEIRVITGGSMKETLPMISKEWVRVHGSKIDMSLSPPGEVSGRILNGEKLDLVIIAEKTVIDLIKKGKVDPASKLNIYRVGTGIAIRAGAAKPDIHTPQALKHALLAAKSIVYSEPSTGAVSGVLFEKIIRRLGIEKEIKAKAIINSTPATVHNAEIVARGEAELGIQLTSEILAVPGVELLEPIPAELQEATTVAAAILSDSKNSKEAAEFLKFLKSPSVATQLKAAGMEPL